MLCRKVCQQRCVASASLAVSSELHQTVFNIDSGEVAAINHQGAVLFLCPGTFAKLACRS